MSSTLLERAARTRRDARRRRPSGHRRALIIVSGGWLALMTGANLAAPLYHVYASRFGFSSLVLTLIFTTYAFTLIPSLLLFGRLSDRFGRRPVLVAGLVVGAAGLALFASAGSTAWLFGARALQGLAVGMVSGPATAALVELDPRRDEQRPALFAGLVQAGGSTLGPLIAGILAEWAPAPYRLSFLVLLGATILAAALTFTLPDARERTQEAWRIQLPRVPAEIRSDFARVSLTAALAWGSVALYLSIVPSYAGELLRTQNLALLGVVAAVALASSVPSQIASQRLHPRPRLAQAAGLVALAAGLVALTLASPTHSLALLLAAAAATGAGHGVAFINTQDELNAIAPAEHRGEVTAAFICCIYVVVAAAVIATGLLGLGGSLSVAVGAVAIVIVALALATAAWHAWRYSPATSRRRKTR